LLIYLSLILLGAASYVILQTCLIISWRKLPLIYKPISTPRPLVSIVVAVRNEAEHIKACITSLFDQTYPRSNYEVIVVDNHSTDRTLSICHSLQTSYPLRVIDLSVTLPVYSAFKKEALTAGIGQAQGAIILTTDGDCVVPSTWIEVMTDRLAMDDAHFVTGPVLLQTGIGLLQSYQLLEIMSLMVATGGGIHSKLLLMSNGANMGFLKSSFEQISGYDKKVQAASGDDVFLMQKIASISPAKVAFIKSPAAIVQTGSVYGFQAFLRQRKRWASKATQYQHFSTKMSAVIVVFNSLLICLAATLAFLLAGPYLVIFLVHFVSKIAIDTWMIREGKFFFNKKSNWYQNLFAHLFNPVANVLILVLTLSSKKYLWKGRITR
jgi:cellulose synthase/poly-beta-1,6-N-acetylglucosamine synthase-like glycosyltransferase